MSKLRLKISMSLDGFVAGPNQSVKEPLGVGGERLHEWVIGDPGPAGGATPRRSIIPCSC